MRKLILALCVGACALAPQLAQAHDPLTPDGRGDAFALLPLILLALAYGHGLRKRAGGVPLWRRCCFPAGLLLTGFVTATPVAAWSERLFSTHMAQHLTLMLVAAPLFVAARTTHVLSCAGAPLLKTAPMRGLSRIARRLLTPLVVWIGFTGLFLIWHVPALYALALRNGALHALEHASFFLSAYAFWSVIMAPASRHALDHGARLLLVIGAALISGLPGALIALSSRSLYVTDQQATARAGLTPLEDQQLAGLVMWIPGGIVYLGVILALLLGWLRESERRALRSRRGSGLALLVCAATSLALAACDEARPDNLSNSAGDPRKGAQDIAAIGCGACHSIPGVSGATGLVGPPLNRMGRRVYIAGLLRNTPENMEAWLQHPQRFVPGVVMPEMGISAEQSRNITAYLYTLR